MHCIYQLPATLKQITAITHHHSSGLGRQKLVHCTRQPARWPFKCQPMSRIPASFIECSMLLTMPCGLGRAQEAKESYDHLHLHHTVTAPMTDAEHMLDVCRIHVAHFAMGGEKPQEVKRVIHAPAPPPIPPWCKDNNKQCAVWAETGNKTHTYIAYVAMAAVCGYCVAGFKPVTSQCLLLQQLLNGPGPAVPCDQTYLLLDSACDRVVFWHKMHICDWSTSSIATAAAVTAGECEANPGYMVGTKTNPGNCLASCSRCDLLSTPATAAARRLLVPEGEDEETEDQH